MSTRTRRRPRRTLRALGNEMESITFVGGGDMDSVQEMEDRRIPLDVKLRKGPSVFKKNAAAGGQPLLVHWDPHLPLDLGLHIQDGVRGLNLKCDGRK